MAKPDEIPVSVDEFEEHLRDQLTHLKSSCEAYDGGTTSEYRRMATALRILFWNRGRSVSLLRHLNLEHASFLSFARPINPRNLMPEHSLVMVRVNELGAQYLPILDQSPFPPRRVSLDEWLNETIVRDKERQEFSRLDLIKAVADQDGGAHVDGSIDATFGALKRGDAIGWAAVFDGKEEFLKGIERSIIRHVSFEAIESVQGAFSYYLGNKKCKCGSGRKARYCCAKKRA